MNTTVTTKSKPMLRTRIRERFRKFISSVTHWGVDEDGDLTVSFFQRFHFTHYSHGTLYSFGKRPDISDLVPRTTLYEPRDYELQMLFLKMHAARELYIADRSRETLITYCNTVEAVYGHIDKKKRYTLSR